MRIEDQVCSLELAKRLKELGVEQDGLFYYQNNPYNDGQDCIDIMIKEVRSKNGENNIINVECENDASPTYSAFTVAELGEILPDAILFHDSNCYIKCQKKDNEYKIYIDHLSRLVIFFDENEANVRAKILIYLIENGLIKENENATQEREV